MLFAPADSTINALRGHLAEFGLVAPKGPIHLKILHTALKGSDVDLPAPVREMGQIYVRQIEQLTEIIVRLANELEAATKTDQELRRPLHGAGHRPCDRGRNRGFCTRP
jgi:transposase